MATRAEQRRSAQKQLKKKLVLERSLLSKMRRFFTEQNRLVRDVHEATEETFDALFMLPRLEAILDEHYVKTTKQFTPIIIKTFNEELEKNDLEPIPENSFELLAVILLFIRQNVSESAKVITDTSNKEIGKAIAKSDTSKEVYSTLQAKNLGRSNTIAITETQKASEGSKQVVAEEIDVIIAGGLVAGTFINTTKTWFTRMDKKVRPKHKTAEGQEVLASEPFLVGGEFLMFPGDMSLGASTWNIVNCRCVSFVAVSIF